MDTKKNFYKPELDQILETLNEVALVTGTSTELDDVLRKILKIVVEKSHSHSGVIYFLEPVTHRFQKSAFFGISNQHAVSIDEYRQSHPEWDPVQDVRKGEEVSYIPDLQKHPGFTWLSPEKTRGRSCVNIPLKSRGTLNGIMALVDLPGNPLQHSELVLLELIGHQIGLLVENLLLIVETQRRQKESSLLYQIATQFSSVNSYQETVQATAKRAEALVDADVGVVGIIEPDHTIRLIEAIGKNEEEIIQLSLPIHKEEMFSPSKFRNGILISDLDVESPGLFDPSLLVEAGVRSMIAAPLVRGKEVYGFVGSLYFSPHQHKTEEYKLIRNLGHQAAIAIENARLYQEVRSQAALEERQRLAREIHDEAAQSLALIHLQVTTANDLMVQGKIEQAKTSINELKDNVREAYTDMREAIFCLRTNFTKDEEFLNTLQEYLALYRSYYGVRTDLSIENNNLLKNMGIEQKMQIIRIIQEALSNARKHASARKVNITLTEARGAVFVEIDDDGCGFNLSQQGNKNTPHYGIQIMKERAESIGGELKINSQVGKGTCINVRIPIGYQGGKNE